MSDVFDFSSDKISVNLLNIDKSSSMKADEQNLRNGIVLLKKSFENFPGANSIAISLSQFDGVYHPAPFTHVKDVPTFYTADGATALYDSICKGAKKLKEYMGCIASRLGCIPVGTFFVFSDGEPCQDPGTYKEAKKAIEDLNYAGITTVFVAYGKGIKSQFGAELGFMSTIDVLDEASIANFFGVKVSKSLKEQSKRHTPLGKNFFSQYNASKGYSNTTEQAISNRRFLLDDI